jgi:HSP20 family protein
MALVRYQGGSVRSLFDELEDLVSSSYDLVGREAGRLFPGVDIIEENDGYRIFADLPGLTKEQIEVRMDQDVLTIRGEKKRLIEKTEKERYYHFERTYGTFERSFNIPSNVHADSIEAKYSNGVLEIFLKKAEEVKPKAIEIKVN